MRRPGSCRRSASPKRRRSPSPSARRFLATRCPDALRGELLDMLASDTTLRDRESLDAPGRRFLAAVPQGSTLLAAGLNVVLNCGRLLDR